MRLNLSSVPERTKVTSPEATPATAAPASSWQAYRLVLLALLFAAPWVARWAVGPAWHFDRERIRALVEGGGAWGVAVFVVVFCVGELLHIPGLVFVAVAMVAYGRTVGVPIALLGAMASVTFSFVVVRAIGGQPLAAIARPTVRRLLGLIDRRPVTSVALLRLIFQMAPPINYALAMSAVGLRDYLIGSALGLIGPVTAFALFFDWLVNRVT
jgi:uncharacterized membrane protein YdjX (TVP38/TMEM64 family)